MKKLRTIDEYFLEKLEIAENIAKIKELENKELLEKIKELENKPEKENVERIVETKFKCYVVNSISSYNFNYINEKYNNLEFMKKCLEDDDTMKIFLDKKSWNKKNSYNDDFPNIDERLYNYQINFFGTIVGVYIHDFRNNGGVSCSTYIVDNVRICESMEKAQEQLIISQRKEIEYYIKYTLTRNEAK